MVDHRTFALLYSVALVDMAASSLTFALTPGRVLQLGGDAKTVGMLSGFVGALQLVAGPIVGRYSDRVADRRWVLILGLLASALGSEVAVQADEPTMFLLSRVPAGLFAHTLNQLRAVRCRTATLLCCSAML
jgi:MFS family permease